LSLSLLSCSIFYTQIFCDFRNRMMKILANGKLITLSSLNVYELLRNKRFGSSSLNLINNDNFEKLYNKMRKS
jgi:hypothetical protein